MAAVGVCQVLKSGKSVSVLEYPAIWQFLQNFPLESLDSFGGCIGTFYKAAFTGGHYVYPYEAKLFEDKHLCGPSFNTFIQKVTVGKNMFLPLKKKGRLQVINH